MKTTLSYILLLISAIAAAGEAPAEPTRTDLNEKVLKLVAQLGSDEFSVREDATKQLLELGEKAVEIIKSLAKSEDAEVRMRLNKIRTLSSLGEVKTLAEAMALRQKFLDENKPELALTALKKAETLGDSSEMGASLLASGLATYRQFKQGARDKERVLKRAAQEMELSIDYYSNHLKAHPDDKAAEARQTEASMLLYSCQKMSTL